MCYETDCYWQDIGRFEDYEQASADFAKDPKLIFAGYENFGMKTALITGSARFLRATSSKETSC